MGATIQPTTNVLLVQTSEHMVGLHFLDPLELGPAMLVVWTNELEMELMSQFRAKYFIVTARCPGLFFLPLT